MMNSKTRFDAAVEMSLVESSCHLPTTPKMESKEKKKQSSNVGILAKKKSFEWNDASPDWKYITWLNILYDQCHNTID